MGKKRQRMKITPLRMLAVKGKDESCFTSLRKFFCKQSNLFVARDKETGEERERLEKWTEANERAKGFPFGESRWRDDQRKGGEKVKAEAQRSCSQGGPLQ